MICHGKDIQILTVLCILSSSMCKDYMAEQQMLGIRKSILKFNRRNPGALHEVDVDRVSKQDWFIQRYFDEYKSDQDVVSITREKILSAFKFFKRLRLHEIDESYFPREFYATGFLYRFGQSKKKEPVLGVVLRCAPNFSVINNSTMVDLGLLFAYYHALKFTMDSMNGGSYIHVSATKMGVTHIDFDTMFRHIPIAGIFAKPFDKRCLLYPLITAFTKNIIFFVNEMFANFHSTVIVTNLHWIMQQPVNLLLGLVKETVQKKIKFVKLKSIKDWVELNDIPVHAGGSNKDYVRFPKGAKSGKCLPHLKISNENWDDFINQNKACIKEGMIESKMNSIEEYLGGCD